MSNSSTFEDSFLTIRYSVDKCLEMCGLEAFRDATVGSLNVENRKRTTIGVELAAKVCFSYFDRKWI